MYNSIATVTLLVRILTYLTHAFDSLVALRTDRSQVVLKAALTVQEVVLLDKATIHQVPTACSVGANEM